MSQSPKAVLLDVDGTLLDSNDAHARAWVDVGVELGFDISYDKARRLIGMGGDKVLPALTGVEDGTEQGEHIKARRTEIFMARYVDGLRPTPGARAFCHRLRDDGIKLVVATSANEQEMGILLEKAGVQDLMQDTTNADEAEKSKPDPDIVQAALRKAGFSADETLMLGDTPYDVEAANRAGVRIVAVRCGGWDDADLRGAVAVFENPAELLERFDESPFGRGS